jgi:thiamine transporter ThiT
MWISLSIIAIVLLVLFFPKGPNAIWGGLTIGLLVGIVMAIVGTGFNWFTIGKATIIGTLVGGAADLLGLVSDKLRTKENGL